MRTRLASFVTTMVTAVAATLIATAGPAGAASQTGPYRIGDPAGERFALRGTYVLSTRVSIVPPPAPTSWYHLNQQWYLRDAGSGSVKIVNARLFMDTYELCLVTAATPAAQPYAHVGGCGLGTAVWTLQDVPGGLRLISEAEGDCLTMPPAGSPDIDLSLQPCGVPDQTFVISPAP